MSAITKAIHFEQIIEHGARGALEQIDTLGVRLFVPDNELSRIAFDWTLRLKRAAAYDSFYFALAQGFERDFWTADKRLFNGLTDSHVEWLHWIEELAPLNR
jgi:predicted nucleic acid-binding protein